MKCLIFELPNWGRVSAPQIEAIEARTSDAIRTGRSWPERDNIDFTLGRLLNSSLRLHDYLCREKVQRIIQLDLDGVRHLRLFIWPLLDVHMWMGRKL